MGSPDGQAVIVGATGAVGTTVTRRLTARGLRVVAVARNESALRELAADNALVTPCVADIEDDSAIQYIEHALSGPVRLALFCAGLPVRGSADTIDPSTLAVGSNIKLGGIVRLLRAVRDHFDSDARFITLAGSMGLEPKPHEAGPGAINAGVFNLMRQISWLYGPRGVTTHTIAPGPIDSPRLRRIAAAVADERGISADEVMHEYRKETSRGRITTLDEVAWAIMLLLDPEAAVLHGSVLNLDGGMRYGVQ